MLVWFVGTCLKRVCSRGCWSEVCVPIGAGLTCGCSHQYWVDWQMGTLRLRILWRESRGRNIGFPQRAAEVVGGQRKTAENYLEGDSEGHSHYLHDDPCGSNDQDLLNITPHTSFCLLVLKSVGRFGGANPRLLPVHPHSQLSLLPMGLGDCRLAVDTVPTIQPMGR